MASDTVSTEYPGEDYIPFTTADLILEGVAGRFTIEDFRILTGTDFWGLYVRGANGTVKEALYNAYAITDIRSVEAEQHDFYRNQLWDDFSVATDRVGLGETLVLHKLQHDGWCAEATRTSETDWTLAFKKSPHYGTECIYTDWNQPFTIHGNGVRPDDRFAGPVSITMLPQEIRSLKARLEDGEQILYIHMNGSNDRSILIKKETDTMYYAWDYRGREYKTYLQMDVDMWDRTLSWLSANRHHISVTTFIFPN
jgi:hypothetical protein